MFLSLFVLRAPENFGEGGLVGSHAPAYVVENLRKPFIRFPIDFLSAHAACSP